MSTQDRSSDVSRVGHGGEYVTLTIRDQLFGLPINMVEDVFEPQMVTRVPLASAEVVGVLNLRGRIVTVVDICAKLGIAHEVPDKPMAIGLRRDGGAFALLVDSVGDVIHPDEASFEPVPSHLDHTWRSICIGVHQLEGKLMMVLDPTCLFESEPEARVA